MGLGLRHPYNFLFALRIVRIIVFFGVEFSGTTLWAVSKCSKTSKTSKRLLIVAFLKSLAASGRWHRISSFTFLALPRETRANHGKASYLVCCGQQRADYCKLFCTSALTRLSTLHVGHTGAGKPLTLYEHLIGVYFPKKASRSPPIKLCHRPTPQNRPITKPGPQSDPIC
jgi:hypothetical protein